MVLRFRKILPAAKNGIHTIAYINSQVNGQWHKTSNLSRKNLQSNPESGISIILKYTGVYFPSREKMRIFSGVVRPRDRERKTGSR